MKKLSIYILAAFVVAACGSKDPRAELEELKTQKHDIEKRIKELEIQIGASDTSVQEAVEVAVIVPGKIPFTVTDNFQGVVESEENVNLSSETGGKILKIQVKEGDMVSKGQALAVLDGDLIAKNIEEVENALELAETSYQRQKNLWDQKIGSEIQFLQAKNQKENLEKRLNTLRTQLGKQTLKAPVAGMVDKLFLKEGEVAGPGIPVCRVVNNDRIKITADISEKFVGRFKKGEKVNILLTALNENLEGKIRSVGQVIDPNNRTFSLIVDPVMPKNRDILKANMLTSISIASYTKPDAVVLPTNIIQFDPQGNFVFAAENNVVKKVMVETGSSSNGLTEVTGGLSGSEKIIAEGIKSIEVGGKVVIRSQRNNSDTLSAKP
ncbi:MAG: efflux RND transporter periplasmic adaptor subunit [Bacteroidia bacterium]|nr:efflux RND transporter periplasmic adaptor subunit [Bacteroidia bacterium]